MPASDTWGQTRSGWSGQGQEELFHLLDTEGGWGAGGIPGDALPHRAGDQLEPGPVGLDHADDATDLALGAAQPLEDLLGLGLILQLHVTLPVRRRPAHRTRYPLGYGSTAASGQPEPPSPCPLRGRVACLGHLAMSRPPCPAPGGSGKRGTMVIVWWMPVLQRPGAEPDTAQRDSDESKETADHLWPPRHGLDRPVG